MNIKKNIDIKIGRQRFVPHLQHLHEKHKQIEFFNQILDAMTWG